MKEWFKTTAGRITLFGVGFVAVGLIVIFNQQITDLLSLFGSRANTGHTIVVNGNPSGSEVGFLDLGKNWDAQPDKTNCFKIDPTTHRLLLNSTCPQPLIASLAPTSGPANQSVVITGSGFVPNSKVKFGDADATITNLTATAITVTAPAHAVGKVPVSVTSPGGPISSFDGYTYTDAPVVVGINPNAGDVDQVVNITGSGFVSGATVKFGVNPATNVVFIDSANMTATAPAGSGDVDVIVTNPDNQESAPVPTDIFHYIGGI